MRRDRNGRKGKRREEEAANNVEEEEGTRESL